MILSTRISKDVCLHKMVDVKEAKDFKMPSFAKYIVLQKKPLGQGMFGAAYLGKHVDTDKTVVIKRFLRDRKAPSTDQLRLAAAQVEVNFAKRTMTVPHSNVVALLAVVEDSGDDMHLPGHALIMEHCNLGTLQDFIRHRREIGKSLTESEAVNVALQLFSGVIQLHSLPMVHCDLATRNIFISRDDEKNMHLKIADFGCAQDKAACIESLPLLREYSAHIPPGELGISYESDFFAIGVVVCEALALKVVSDGSSHFAAHLTIKELFEQVKADLTAYPVLQPIICDLLHPDWQFRLSVHAAFAKLLRIRATMKGASVARAGDIVV